MIDVAEVTLGYSGVDPAGDEIFPCDEDGETEDGYVLDSVIPATWVKVLDF